MKADTFGPNPTGDQDKGWALVAVCWAFVICAFTTTVLRIWIRSRLTRNLGWDDWVMVFAMVCLALHSSHETLATDIIQFTTIIGAGFVTAGVVNGLGRHEYYLTPSQRRVSRVLGWADWIQTFITLALVKISICLFLLRIVESRNIKRGMYALIGFTTLFTAICVFLFLGVCRPIKAYWDVGVDGKCLSNQQVEAIIIAQGSKSHCRRNTCRSLNDRNSPLSHRRPHLRSPSNHLPPEPADQQTNQNRPMSAHGSWCNVHPLSTPRKKNHN